MSEAVVSKHAPKAWYRSKAFNLCLGLVVTTACLVWAVHQMAAGASLREVFRQIGEAFAQANYWSVVPIWAVLFAFYWLKAWRWKMLLAPLGDYSTSRLFPPVMIGFAFNNVLPAHLGEFVRVYVLARKERLPLSAVLSSVALERIFDTLALLALLGWGLTSVADVNPDVQRSAMFVAVLVLIGLTGAIAYLFRTHWFLMAFEWCLSWMPFVPEALAEKLTGLLETAAKGLAALKSGRLLAGITLTSLVQWALNALIVYLSLWSFGFSLPPLVSCVVMGVVAFGVAVPSSPGYFGVIQLCFVMVLKVFVPESQLPAVMAASIYFHVVQWVPVTAVGGFYFFRSGFSVAEIESEAESGADASR